MTTNTVQQRVLVVDDSQAIGRAVQKAIEMVVDLPVDYVASYAECARAIRCWASWPTADLRWASSAWR